MTRNPAATAADHCGRVTKVTGSRELRRPWRGPGIRDDLRPPHELRARTTSRRSSRPTDLCNEYGMDTTRPVRGRTPRWSSSERGQCRRKDVWPSAPLRRHAALIRAIEAMGRGEGFGTPPRPTAATGGAEKYGHPELFIGSKKQPSPPTTHARDRHGARVRHVRTAALSPARLHGLARALRKPSEARPVHHDEKGAVALPSPESDRVHGRVGHLPLLHHGDAPQMLADMVGTGARHEADTGAGGRDGRAHLEPRARLQPEAGSRRRTTRCRRAC